MVRLPVVSASAVAAANPTSVRRADVSDAQWQDWRWQLSNRVNTLEEIERSRKQLMLAMDPLGFDPNFIF